MNQNLFNQQDFSQLKNNYSFNTPPPDFAGCNFKRKRSLSILVGFSS